MVSIEVKLNSFCTVIWIHTYWSLGVECGGLNENGFQRLMFEHLVPSWWSCPGRITRCSLVERGVSLGVNVEVSKTMLFP